MEVEAEDFQVADEAEKAAETRDTTTKRRKMVIIGTNLCKYARSQIGKAGSSGEQDEEIKKECRR